MSRRARFVWSGFEHNFKTEIWHLDAQSASRRVIFPSGAAFYLFLVLANFSLSLIFINFSPRRPICALLSISYKVLFVD